MPKISGFKTAVKPQIKIKFCALIRNSVSTFVHQCTTVKLAFLVSRRCFTIRGRGIGEIVRISKIYPVLKSDLL